MFRKIIFFYWWLFVQNLIFVCQYIWVFIRINFLDRWILWAHSLWADNWFDIFVLQNLRFALIHLKLWVTTSITAWIIWFWASIFTVECFFVYFYSKKLILHYCLLFSQSSLWINQGLHLGKLWFQFISSNIWIFVILHI